MKLNRKLIKKMVLKEMAKMADTDIKALDTSGIYRPQGSDINKELAIEMLNTIIFDLQNIPEHNFDKYIQHLISYQLPNIIRTLRS
tara:strand:- start:177 stop:434 length:258 start_codon:yes stop_codon:yes gene_type:complete